MNKNSKFFVFSFYRFIILNNLPKIKKNLDLFLENKNIKGTILVSKEGINGSISGSKLDLQNCIRHLKKLIKIQKLEIKANSVKSPPFKKLKVRLKKEIVSLAKGRLNVSSQKGKRIEPSEWDKFIINKNAIVIDVRNKYEIEIGSFSNTINPETKNFREFPSAFKKLSIPKDTNIAMYCTGGIRCEKASAYLKLQGYKNIYQLKGGILNYLEYMSKNNEIQSNWKNECFVFDERVTVNAKLQKGKYYQCYGCRRPITSQDKKSHLYKEGVHCPRCYNERTDEQIRSSKSRQKQIELNKINSRTNHLTK